MRWQTHRYAPAPGTRLCHTDAIPDGACTELRYGNADAAFGLLLYRRGTQIRVYVNSCPHFSLPLNARPNQFLLLPDDCMMCAWHSAVFRLEDGRCIDGPAKGSALGRVPVYVVDGQIFIGEPSA